MAKKKKETREVKIERPARTKLSAKESLKRMQEFSKRKGKFVATARKSEDRGISSGSA